MDGSTGDVRKKGHVEPTGILVIAEGKISEGRKKVHLEELKVFGPGAMEPEGLQIIFYVFDDGHIEVYENVLELIFDEKNTDAIPQYTVLVKGEMARPLSMPGNPLVRLDLGDGSDYGQPLDDHVVQALATGTTADVKAVFDQVVQPFPEHQFLFLKVEPTNQQIPQTVVVANEQPSTSVRVSAKSSRSRKLADGKNVTFSKRSTKKILNEFKPNADKNPLRSANGMDDGTKAMALDKVVNKRKSKEDKTKAYKMATDGVVRVAVVSPQKPTPRKKSEKAKRPKTTCSVSSPKATPHDDTSLTRFSPRLKTIDENTSHVAVKPTKKVKKAAVVSSSKNPLPHVKLPFKTLVDVTTLAETVPDPVKIRLSSPEPLPKRILNPVFVPVKTLESVSEPQMPKPVYVRLPAEQPMLDSALKSNKEMPRHQSLRIALQTFRNLDVQGNEDSK